MCSMESSRSMENSRSIEDSRSMEDSGKNGNPDGEYP